MFCGRPAWKQYQEVPLEAHICLEDIAMNSVSRCKTTQVQIISGALARNCRKVSLCLALGLIWIVSSTLPSPQSLTITPSSLNFPNPTPSPTRHPSTHNAHN